MAIGVIELMVMAVGLSLFLIPLLTLVAIGMQPSEAWESSGHSRLIWLLLVVFVPMVGSIAYFVAVHKDVSAAASRTTIATAR